jgi:hypothetical protein
MPLENLKGQEPVLRDAAQRSAAWRGVARPGPAGRSARSQLKTSISRLAESSPLQIFDMMYLKVY